MKFSLTIIFTLIVFVIKGQTPEAYLKENAVKINKADSLDNSLYKLFSDFQLIMLGEMHGTNEPAKLLIGFTELLCNNGDSVQVGLEIPANEMTKFLSDYSDSSVYTSEFFSKKSLDGRASFAWASIILTLKKNKKVKFFFFDTFSGSKSRDSLLYINIKKQILNNKRWKTIVLSGNIHNMVEPYKGKKTMGFYLKNDSVLNLSDKVCSLNHVYNMGTMYNNQGRGLELKQIENRYPEYSEIVDYNNYLALFSKNYANKYTGIFFTKYVTASKAVTKK